MTLEDDLAMALREIPVSLDGATQERLLAYLRLIEKWNRVYNLTAVREPRQMVSLHLLDSLAILPHLAHVQSLVDVGSGAGLPGIPLAIVRPDLQVTLLDSNQKKATFLRQARAELALTNIQVVCERVESWRPAQRFEVVVSRAFADLADFVALAGHLVLPGGMMLAMKGVHPHEELTKIPPDYRVERVVRLRVPTLDAERHLVLLKAA